MIGLYCLGCGSKDIEIKNEIYTISHLEYEDNKIVICRHCNNKIEFDKILNLYKGNEVYSPRKIQLSDGETYTYMTRCEKNPCGCGSNCFHLENDNKTTYGVCNACGRDIYEYEFEEFKEWRYKNV